VPDAIIIADTVRSAELRHEVPLSVPDAFFYAEADGKRYAVAHSMEVVRLAELDGLEALPVEEFGYDDLVREGRSRVEIAREVHLRACRRFGISAAVVPPTFPLESADHLRANGVDVQVDRDFFDARRRSKNQRELAGIARAQRATEAAMTAVRDTLRRAETANGALVVDGQPLTSERLRALVGEVFNAHDATGDDMIISHGPQAAVGHDMGSGAIAPGETIVVDLFPKDRESSCYADMTRTFVVGDVADEVRDWHRLCLEALETAIAAVRPGADCKAIHLATCDLFERNGYPTARSKEPGKPLEDGFYHGLGHGVGLDVHERPGLGLTSDDTLVAGDVITIEPGLYRAGFGGVRLEDLVLVTEDGAENLTNFPYDLNPAA
jgi:Xaa-Pro aminopeptidase